MRRRLWLGLLLVATVLLGFALRFRVGPAWLRNASGAVLYDVAWILAAQIVWIRARTGRLAVAVFGGTCVVELLQLSDAPLLRAARGTTPGRLLLGSEGGFDLLDFPLYLLGCLLGYVLCRRFRAPSGYDRREPR